MKIIVDIISSRRITYRHHGKCRNKEESKNTQRLIMHKLHPKVCNLHVFCMAFIHHHPLTALGKAKYQQAKTYNTIKHHGLKPGTIGC